MSEREPTTEQFRAAIDAFNKVEEDLDVRWVAHKPIQGDATHKVFAYNIAKAVLNHADTAARDARIREDALKPVRALVEDLRRRSDPDETRQSVKLRGALTSKIATVIDTPAQADGGGTE